jgi:hypothetical protein
MNPNLQVLNNGCDLSEPKHELKYSGVRALLQRLRDESGFYV